MAVVRFSCGHVGRTNESPRATVQAFIRVAEIRKDKVSDASHVCPDCKNGVSN